MFWPSFHSSLLVLILTLFTLFQVTHQHEYSWNSQHLAGGRSRAGENGKPAFSKPLKAAREPKKHRSEKPNIIFIITDDQDAELGSLEYMPKTMKILRDGGAMFPHAYTTTPMCCPSRSSMLTGMYVHNHNTYTNNDNCSSPQWRATHETRNFGTYLSNVGYRTGYFGKYLNEYTGAYIPPGWTEWMGLIRNTRFYNYSVNFNGQKIKHEDDYHKDYLTDLIANNSVSFLRQSKQYFPNRPVAMVLSMPAPHGPEDAAPQYQNMFIGVQSHRTKSWNFAPNPDKQWLLQYTGKMSPIHIAFTDLLHTKRLQTLQSVDDAVKKVYDELSALGELDNTYIIYTSDHGYHLGQYGLVKGKAMPYEFDIRVPFFMRGPNIPSGISVPNIVINLDIAPTLLDIAGVPIPDHMDGNSVVRLFDEQEPLYSGTRRREGKKVWRDAFLVERGKLTQRKLKVKEKLEAQYNRLVQTKEQRLTAECSKSIYQSPCAPQQQWECRRNEEGKLRIYKCRPPRTHGAVRHCQCADGSVGKLRRPSESREMQRQMKFLKHHVNKPEEIQQEFILEKKIKKRLAHLDKTANGTLPVLEISLSHHRKREHLTNKTNVKRHSKRQVTTNDPELSTQWTPVNLTAGGAMVPCRMSDNNTIVCERYVYTSLEQWQAQKDNIDQILKQYTDNILFLKDVRKHLLEKKPQHGAVRSAHTIPPSAVITPGEIHSTKTTDTETTSSSHSTSPPRNHDNQEEMLSEENVDDFLDHILVVDDDDDDAGGEEEEEEDNEVDGHEENVAEEREEEVGLAGLVTEIVVEEDDEQEEERCICGNDLNTEPTGRGKIHNSNKHNGNKLEVLSRQIDQREEKERLRKLEKANARLEMGGKKRKSKRKFSRQHHSSETSSAGDCATVGGKCSRLGVNSPPAWPSNIGLSASNNSSATLNWDGVDISLYSSRRDPMCHIDGLECSRMDDEHWKVKPYWRNGPFCFCPNSNNNTYWCLRSINDTHNFLFCEFITGFISYYDMIKDPFQLRNAVHDLEYSKLHELHAMLERMKGCKGSRQCNLQEKDTDDVLADRARVKQNGREAVDDDRRVRNSNHKHQRTSTVY